MFVFTTKKKFKTFFAIIFNNRNEVYTFMKFNSNLENKRKCKKCREERKRERETDREIDRNKKKTNQSTVPSYIYIYIMS